MFFNAFVFCPRAPPYDPRYTYVERLADGRLCLVRNKYNCRKSKRNGHERGSEVEFEEGNWALEPERPHRDVHVHDHDWKDPILQHEGHCRDNPGGEEGEARPNPNPSPDKAPLSPRLEERRSRQQSRSPVFIVRDPQATRLRPHIESVHGHGHRIEIQPELELERVPLQKVRFQEVRVKKKACLGPPSPAERHETNHQHHYHHSDPEEFVRVKIPKGHPHSRLEPGPQCIPEDEISVWDEKMRAWMVRRAPRVRFL